VIHNFTSHELFYEISSEWFVPHRLIVAITVVFMPFLAIADPSPIVPDPRMTPGDVLTNDTTVICQTG